MPKLTITRRGLLASALAAAGCRSSRSSSQSDDSHSSHLADSHSSSEHVEVSANALSSGCPSATPHGLDKGFSASSSYLPQHADVHVHPPQEIPAFSWDATGPPRVLPRRAADAKVQKSMEAAYGMLEDGSSAGMTPVSILSQAYLHAMYCHGGNNGEHSIHAPGNFFLAWHRAAMFFHERLIQWVLKDPGFRLPYWEPSSKFGIYGNGALNHPRGIKSSSPILPKSLLGIADFSEAAIQIYDWHAGVHAAFCGDFGIIAQAGLDPLFYGFHTFVDRVWDASQVKRQMELGSGWGVFFNPYQRTNPNNQESGWVYVDLREFSDPSDWGYTYDPPLSPDTLVEPSGLIFRDVPLGEGSPSNYTISAQPKGAGQATTLAVLEPFGRGQDPYRRIDLDQARVNELLNGSWEFVVTPAQHQAPIVLRPNQVASALSR